jgi:hypothetical protein
VIKQATLAQARAAGGTVEFVAVANVVATLTAFYSSIDKLKHPNFSPPRISRSKTIMPCMKDAA